MPFVQKRLHFDGYGSFLVRVEQIGTKIRLSRQGGDVYIGSFEIDLAEALDAYNQRHDKVQKALKRKKK